MRETERKLRETRVESKEKETESCERGRQKEVGFGGLGLKP